MKRAYTNVVEAFVNPVGIHEARPAPGLPDLPSATKFLKKTVSIRLAIESAQPTRQQTRVPDVRLERFNISSTPHSCISEARKPANPSEPCSKLLIILPSRSVITTPHDPYTLTRTPYLPYTMPPRLLSAALRRQLCSASSCVTPKPVSPVVPMQDRSR